MWRHLDCSATRRRPPPERQLRSCFGTNLTFWRQHAQRCRVGFKHHLVEPRWYFRGDRPQSDHRSGHLRLHHDGHFGWHSPISAQPPGTVLVWCVNRAWGGDRRRFRSTRRPRRQRGAAGQVLTSNGAAADPSFQTLAVGSGTVVASPQFQVPYYASGPGSIASVQGHPGITATAAGSLTINRAAGLPAAAANATPVLWSVGNTGETPTVLVDGIGFAFSLGAAASQRHRHDTGSHCRQRCARPDGGARLLYRSIVRLRRLAATHACNLSRCKTSHRYRAGHADRIADHARWTRTR